MARAASYIRKTGLTLAFAFGERQLQYKYKYLADLDI